MTMNIFEETYKIEADAIAKYEVAKTEEEKNELRNIWNAAKDKLSELGDHAWIIYREYAHARKNGNEILDFNDIEVSEYAGLFYNVLKDNCHCYVMCNNKNLIDFLNEFTKVGFKFVKNCP